MTSIDAGPAGALRIAPSILAADFGALAHAVQEIDEQTALSHIKKIPTAVVRDALLCGTPDEIVDRAAQWRDAGVRYIVIANIGMLQRYSVSPAAPWQLPWLLSAHTQGLSVRPLPSAAILLCPRPRCRPC